MKRGFHKVAKVLGILALVLCAGVGIAAAQETERIEQFDVELELSSDGTLKVQEEITYNFGPNERHGIFRTIPLKGISIEDIEVIGAPFEVSKSGGELSIQIGDPDTFVTGVQVYEIAYTVFDAVRFFDSYDEVYWNVTGNEWEVPINAASVRFLLPEDASMLQAACYRGVAGSTAECVNATSTAQVFFASAENLQAREGLTIAVGFPKGIIYEPTLVERILSYLSNNIIAIVLLLIPIGVLIFMFRMWREKGKDPEGSGTIVPQYDLPKDLTPLEMGALMNDRLDPKYLSAEIIHLAERGYLRINRIEKKVLGFDTSDYEIELVKKPEAGDVTLADQEILDALFKDTTIVKLSDLKSSYSFHSKIRGISKTLFTELTEKGFYLHPPYKSMQEVYWYMSIFVVAITVLTYFVLEYAHISMMSMFVSVAIFIVFSFIMPAKTAKGVEMKEYALGLKDYLQVAEKDRIAFHNAPEKNPKLFEKLLPAAIALGVDKAWAKEFAGMYLPQPSWYQSSGNIGFDAAVFSSHMSSFSESFASAAVPAGSGSGSGGGGFSGGGSGGGGGGSW